MTGNTTEKVTTTWTELVPRLAARLLRRAPSDDERDELATQFDAAVALLANGRFCGLAGCFGTDDLDELKVAALMLAAGMAVDAHIDQIFAALEPDERYRVLEHIDVLEEAWVTAPVSSAHEVPAVPFQPGGRSGGTPLQVEPLAQRLVAATPVSVSQVPGVHEFRVLTSEGEAVVEVRLGGGPLLLRQSRGPRLGLVDDVEPLPEQDVVEAHVADGVDLAGWLRDALRLVGDDDDPAKRA